MIKCGWYCSLLFFLFCSCQNQPEIPAVFERLNTSETGINFRNQLEYDEQLNTYTYRNFYNGAGVAVGDINNDGLQDLYFAGNLVDNQLYLNKGDFKFEDITGAAGVASANVWSTGVSMADVNGDGWLDIYVCKSGPLDGDNRNNELFINNGDLTFTEQAEAYGVADLGLSNHAAFLDYDKDGDLDFYLLNNSTRSVGIYDLRKGQRDTPDPEGGNKLYRNDGGHFKDVTSEAGIYSSAIGYGLGVTVADVNVDGWPDIFVSNDFFERDYLYINAKDGTFRESLEDYITESSMGSMGADIADLNGDGYPEIYVTEMLPESMERVKTKTLFEDWDKYQANIKNGYHHQFTRNSLQLNQGAIPGDADNVFFSEVSRLKGLHATDWSWGALIFDFDNDGNKDLFVANGIYKDLTDQDYINFYASNSLLFDEHRKDSTVITNLIDVIPSVPLPNYLFRNKGGFDFDNVASEAGLADPSFSNGAVYSDLDNDGDLDLVVNNINDEAFVYKNKSAEQGDHHYLMLNLQGNDENPFAFGTRVSVFAGGTEMVEEHNPVKGYMSSMDYRMHFGLGQNAKADSLHITWPDGSLTKLAGVQADQLLKVNQTEGLNASLSEATSSKPAFEAMLSPLDYIHKENEFSDFDRDRLIFQMSSNEGPALAKGDVNGDGLEDFYLGGAKGFAGQVFVQSKDGTFGELNIPAFEDDKMAEDVDADLADLDGDGDLDLLVAGGGNEFGLGDPNLRDRIYLNSGSEAFTRLPFAQFPISSQSSGFIKAFDYDGDGDQDIITGTRLTPFSYGVPGDAFLFENQGNAVFRNVTEDKAPDFKGLGLLTDALVADLDGDQDLDLVFVGEWMPVRIFLNEDGSFKDHLSASGLKDSHGLWKTIESGDFNGDGLIDFAVGNMGLNTRLMASTAKPLTLHINDFDKNGSVEQITCMYDGEKAVPIIMLKDLVKQLPGLRKKYIKYDSYKDKTLDEIFSPDALENMLTLEVRELASSLFINQGNGAFEKILLPEQAQISQTYAIHATDTDDDGYTDLILGGNQTRMKPELGINNASYGLTLRGLGNGSFEPLKAIESGIFVKGEVRQVESINSDQGPLLIFVRNNDELKVFRRNSER
ncbi:MAG: CRTAC1 family protein [Roseivirga sp.]|nr:CRTAC1 family protein [Roseivirga sp.]